MLFLNWGAMGPRRVGSGSLTAMAVRRRSLPFMLSYAAVLAGCGDANPASNLFCTASTVRKFWATARLMYPSGRSVGSKGSDMARKNAWR